MGDQAAALRERVQRSSGGYRRGHSCVNRLSAPRSIAVTSGKGGVGKSTIALSLAVALGTLKKKVLVVDADLGLANIHILLGLAPRRTLGHLLEGRCSVEDIIQVGPAGIHLLPGASGMRTLANAGMERVLFLRRSLATLEQQYDFLVIDTCAGIGMSATEFSRYADLPVVVLTPEPTSLADAYAMVKTLHELHGSRVGVLVNMADSGREGYAAFDRLRALVVQFLGEGIFLLDVLPRCARIVQDVKQQRYNKIPPGREGYTGRMNMLALRLSGLPAATGHGFFQRIFSPFSRGECVR